MNGRVHFEDTGEDLLEPKDLAFVNKPSLFFRMTIHRLYIVGCF